MKKKIAEFNGNLFLLLTVFFVIMKINYGEKDLIKAEALLSQLTLAYNQHEKNSISKEEINSLEKVVYETLCRIVERNN